jgi:calcium-dependent protein kinase
LDKNLDGKLSKEELVEGFTETMGQTAAEVEVDRIMKNVDIDKNGHIDYSEFISATIDKRKLLSKDRLKAAFAIFDRDDNGFISAQEVRHVLDHGKKLNE